MGKWTDDQMSKFIQLYGYHSCLWNTSTEEYKNKEARRHALDSIVAEMNIAGFGVSECKIKIKNMRSHYCQELKKVRESMKSGDPENVYKPVLSWFETLDMFLRDFVQQITFTPNVKRKLESDNEDSEDIIDPPRMIEVVYAEDPLTTNNAAEELKRFNKPSRQSNLNKRIKVENDTNETVPTLNMIENLSLAKDKGSGVLNHTEFDIFGCSVAAQLNSMPLVEAIELQLHIQQLITQYRLGKIEESNRQNPG